MKVIRKECCKVDEVVFIKETLEADNLLEIYALELCDFLNNTNVEEKCYYQVVPDEYKLIGE